jgi:GNAT superfamily N-acetyltransferase
MRYLVGGTRRAGRLESRARSLLDSLHKSDSAPGVFLWARQGRGIRGVVLVLSSPGQVGFAYLNPPDAPGADHEVMIDLLNRAMGEAFAGGASMIQAVLEPGMNQEKALLRAAGFTPLAELVYLQCDLHDRTAEPPTGPWRFVNAPAVSESVLIDLLPQTYQDTQDCPDLAGRREIRDVLASHRFTGIYEPRWWWLAEDDAGPVGCVLVNRSVQDYAAEVVYMGVVPRARRAGLGRALLSQAACSAQQDSRVQLRLAADSNNTPALRLYESFGFYETSRRLCFTRLKTTSDKGKCE